MISASGTQYGGHDGGYLIGDLETRRLGGRTPVEGEISAGGCGHPVMLPLPRVWGEIAGFDGFRVLSRFRE